MPIVDLAAATDGVARNAAKKITHPTRNRTSRTGQARRRREEIGRTIAGGDRGDRERGRCPIHERLRLIARGRPLGPRRSRRGRGGGEPVVVELARRPARAASPMPAAQPSSSSSGASAARDGERSSPGATTTPVSPSTTASCGAAAVARRPGTRRTRPPRGTRCRSPPARGRPSGRGTAWRTRRRSRTARAGRRRARGRGTAPALPAPRASALEPLAVAAARRRWPPRDRGGRGQPRHGVDQRRRSPCGARAGSARPRAAASPGRARSARARRGALGRVERTEALGVDAGRDDDDRAARARRPASRLGGRVAARATITGRRRAAPARSSRRRTGRRPGTVISAPCSDDAVGPRAGAGRAARAAAPGRADQSASTSRASASMRRASDGVGQQHALAVALDAERLLGVPRRGVGVRRGEHGDVVGRQPPPQLPEVRLDPADLRREVVRDEQVPHELGVHGSGRRPVVGAPAARTIVAVRGGRRPRRAWPAEELVVVAEVGAQRQLDLGIVAVGRCCRGRPARCGGGTAARARGCTSGRALEQRRRRRLRAARARRPTPRSRPGSSPTSVRDAGSAGTPPGTRRSRRGGRRAPPGARRGNDARRLHEPGQAPAGVDHARARRSRRWGTPSRQRRHEPHPSATGAAVARSGASVTTEPSTNQSRCPAAARWRSCRTSPGRPGRRPRGRRARCRRPPPGP